MGAAPANPTIYHITHLENLAKIVEQDVLWSDAKRIEMGLDCQIVGMSRIKERRLTRLEVTCHPGTKVGDYVPFYFCPRSIMLYMLHKGNHVDIAYRGGQRPILHLVTDLRRAVAWADARRRRWAFSASNAGAFYTDFYDDLAELSQIDWAAVATNSWGGDDELQESKAAEFLVHESVPWELVERIGVVDAAVAQQVRQALAGAAHRPPVTVERSWYY